VSAKDCGVTPTGTSLGSYISHRAVVAPRNTKANVFMEPGRMSTEDLDLADGAVACWQQLCSLRIRTAVQSEESGAILGGWSCAESCSRYFSICVSAGSHYYY
jgi:hypothetical protein